jgi:hypothetical protein
MKKLSLLATLALLGASSMAFADPVVVRDHRDDNTDNRDYRDDNTDRNFDGDRNFDRDRDGHIMIDRDHYQPQWISFGTAGTGKTGIAVGSQLGRFQSLRLDASGFMRVRQVVVVFDDGTSQRVKMAGSMSRRSAPLVIDLGGSKRIDRIIVYASQFGRGTISVSGLEAKKIFWRRDRGGDQLDSYQSNH